jgi:hypothetical protein
LHFRRGRPVLSGQASADAIYGYRGISNETNHAYGVLTQTIASNYRYDMTGGVPGVQTIYTTTSGSYVQAIGKVSIELGADVQQLIVTAVIKNGTIKLVTDPTPFAFTPSATIGATPTVVTATCSLSITTGIESDIWIDAKDAGGSDFALYSYCISEVRLVAGDIP